MKLLAVTNLFPDSRRPTHGIFIKGWLEAIRAVTGWEFHVLAPRPVAMPLAGALFPPSLAPKLLPAVEPEQGQGTIIHPRYHHLPGFGVWRQWKAIFSACLPYAKEMVRQHKYKAVLGIYLYPDGVAAARLASWFRLPLILSARGTDGLVLARKALHRRPIRRALGQASLLHAVSNELAGVLEEHAGLARGTVAVVPNGVDTGLFRPGLGGTVRRDLGLDETAGLLLTVGRLEPPKGQAQLIEALPMLPDHYHLLILGEGSREQALRKLAADRGLTQRVHLLGSKAQKDLVPYYQAADFFVLPSLREGCPNALLEALASGLPAVAAPVGQIPMIISRPLGTLIQGRGPKAIAFALNQAMELERDQGRFDEFRRAWSWERRAEEFAKILQRKFHWL